MTESFCTSVAGVTHNNPDGTNRQDILKKCNVGEIIILKREPNNPYDEHAIAVLREKGEQIGYIKQEIAFRHPAFKDLAYYMDVNREVKAKIIEVTGGSSGLFGFGSKKNYGCVIEITQGNIPYLVKEKQAKDLIEEAKNNEKDNPEKALTLYKEIIQIIEEEDKLINETLFYKLTKEHLRKVKYPIVRLSLLLEKNKDYKNCLNEIEKYENTNDIIGLSKSGMENINKRKQRIIKILSK